MNTSIIERAMNLTRVSALCLVAAAAAGCGKEATFTEPLPPLANIHWVNAVPDTMQQDFRVVDIPTSAGEYDVNFRGANMFYDPLEAGTRRVKVFLSSSDPAVTQIFLADTTHAFAEATRYTFIHAGFARAGQSPARAVWVVTDNPPTPATGQLGLRVIHAGAGMAAVDIRVTRLASDTLPDAAAVAGVTYGQVSGYIAIPADADTSQRVRMNITAAGTKTILATAVMPEGIVGTSGVDPVAGSRVAGSVFTAVVVPPSVPGTGATQFTTSAAVYLLDLRPPGTAP